MSQIPPQAPVPVVPVGYAPPSFARRPGLVTAIGVASITIGLATVLANFVIAIMAMGMYAVAQAPRPRWTPPSPAAAANVASEDPINGMSADQRRTVVNVLAGMRPMNPQRRRQFDALLGESGQTMFPISDAPLTATLIRGSVSESGVLPGARGGDGPHFFIIGTGRIEVDDKHAVFRPTGSSDVVSVSAPDIDAAQAAPHVPAPAGAATPAMVRARKIKLTPLPAALTGIEMALSMVLGVFLFVAGIIVLRGSFSGRRLHWIYVWVKIPLAIVAGLSGWWTWTELVTAASAAGRGAPPGNFALGMAVMIALGTLVVLIHPIALVGVLCTRTVRDYYTSVREDELARKY